MRVSIFFFLVATLAFAGTAIGAADSITIGTATADISTVEVPVFVRDVSGTPLGMDRPAGSRIQAIAFKLIYDPAKVATIKFQYVDVVGGVLYGLSPLFSSIPRTPNSISFLASYDEHNSPIPFTLDATDPGNQIGRLVVTLQSGLAPGEHVALTLDEVATSLSNQAGSISESKSSGTLTLTNGEILVGEPRPPRVIIPAAASAPGQFGAFFRTTLQLYNASELAASGTIVFHALGTTGSRSDPSMPFTLLPWTTTSMPDVVSQIGASGVGSIDVYVDSGPLPISRARIFNDAGAAGTSGMYEETFVDESALQVGERAVLVAPPDLGASRFNIGIRTLGRVRMTITHKDREGSVIRIVSKAFDPEYFVQSAAADLLGGDVHSDDVIVFDVLAGQAIIYGSTVDNTTQDPAWQTATRSTAPAFKQAVAE